MRRLNTQIADLELNVLRIKETANEGEIEFNYIKKELIAIVGNNIDYTSNSFVEACEKNVYRFRLFIGLKKPLTSQKANKLIAAKNQGKLNGLYSIDFRKGRTSLSFVFNKTFANK